MVFFGRGEKKGEFMSKLEKVDFNLLECTYVAETYESSRRLHSALVE